VAHIVGISKSAYVLATPRCLDLGRDLQRTSPKKDPAVRRRRVAGLLVVIAAIAAALG